MDEAILIALINLIVIVIVVLLKKFFTNNNEDKSNIDEVQADNAQNDRARRRRARLRNVRNQVYDDDNENFEDDGNQERNRAVVDVDSAEFEKMGAKKRAKLEAKAERKVQREMEEKAREERKKKQAADDEERRKQAEHEAAEEKRAEELARKAREEQERRDYEEYLKMKEAFSVDEEGCLEGEADENENLLQEFVRYIKENKVVVLEDLASNFKMKTQSVIERIQDLQKDGILTGVIDDRGKFIYITQQELKDVAKFIRQRGRISIAELAESSNQLIHLASSAS